MSRDSGDAQIQTAAFHGPCPKCSRIMGDEGCVSCPRSETARATQINVPAVAPIRKGGHVHSCPECYENVPCDYACSTEHDLTLDDGTPRGAYVVCDACKIRKQKTSIACRTSACRTWAAEWRDEYMQYSYDRGVFEGAAILDGLVGMGIAIAQRRERAIPEAVTEHEVQEALAVVNDHLVLGAAITHSGTELKGRTPDGEGDFSKAYFSAGDCSELANAFHVLSVRLTPSSCDSEKETKSR